MAIRRKDANRSRRAYPFFRTLPQYKYEVDNESELGANFMPGETMQTWPALYETTAIEVPASWVLFDPKGVDVTGILLSTSGRNASFTPAFLSGKWTLYAVNDEGEVIHYDEIHLGDSQGFMDAPDWDDPSWSIRSVNGIVSATPGGKQLTIADVAPLVPRPTASYPLPFDADVLYQPVAIPPGATNIEVETQLPTTGDDHTAIVWGGFAVDASGTAGQSNAGGIEQTTFNTQRPIFFRNDAVTYPGLANVGPRRCRSVWPMDDELRTPAIIHQYMYDTGAYFNANAYNMGGMALTPTRDFGLWVNRVTADGSAYNISVTLRLKVT